MDSFYFLLLLLFLEVSGNMQPKILTPQNGEVIEVTLGSHAEIVCNSSIYKDLDSEVYWMKTMNTTMTFLDENEMLPVFYKEQNGSATLTIREVSEEALVFNYTCILTTTRGMDLASISLILKAPPPSYILVVGLPVLLVVVVVMSVVIYVTLRVDIVLFVRDRLGFHGRTSDGKSYDAYIMPFEGPGGVGLTAQDRRMLEAVLEEELGYSLCLYHRDVLPGQAVAKAVLDCIKQSRRLVLVPCSLDQGQNQDQGHNQDNSSEVHHGLLSGLHATLVEHQTQLVLIQTEAPPSDSHTDQDQAQAPLPKAVHLLAQAGHKVTWRGSSSSPLSSPFWKQLRFCLPSKPSQRPLHTPLSYHPC
ncbi:interleukin-18 receptor 1-like [Osmerus mordax]|uniref:interleukin-18 receptor 1-like n=1 Tax=Osmerus mordax TaxID=8014 RepID=UPI003510BEBF